MPPTWKLTTSQILLALQVSRQQTLVPSRFLCPLEHWHLSTVQPDCCTLPELPAQAKLICSSVLLTEKFLQHHYIYPYFLKNWQEFLKNCCSGIVIYHFSLLLVTKNHAVSCTFTWRPPCSLHTQCSPQTAPNIIFASGLEILYLKKEGNVHVDQTSRISNHPQDSR